MKVLERLIEILCIYESANSSCQEYCDLPNNHCCDKCKHLADYLLKNGVIVPPETGIGDLSDGFHTFNELYHHRAILFSVICNIFKDIAWKSKKHDTGDMFDGMFIVGIQTPFGQATYHYDIDPYWDLFQVKELPNAPKWDGHTPDDAIKRISTLTINNVISLPCKVGDTVYQYGKKFTTCTPNDYTPRCTDDSMCIGCCCECDSKSYDFLYEGTIIDFIYNGEHIKVGINWKDKFDTSYYEIGKKVFLSKEEAVKTLQIDNN